MIEVVSTPIGRRSSLEAFVESATRIRQDGFPRMEIAFPTLAGDGGLSCPFDPRNLVRPLKSAGMAIEAIASACRVGPAEETAGHAVDRIHLARLLGAPLLNLSFLETGSRERMDRPPSNASESNSIILDVLRQVRYEAEAAGVTIALEACANASFSNPLGLREVIDEANSWTVGACVDTGRTMQGGAAGDWLRTLRQRVRCVRLRISRPQNGETIRLAPELSVVLREIHYEGPVVYQMDVGEGL
jgi:sugar phosphate isomerase/epimerase